MRTNRAHCFHVHCMKDTDEHRYIVESKNRFLITTFKVWFTTGLPDFSWTKHTKMGKIYQMTTNYIHQIDIKYTKWSIWL
jgi:hypothetical protein